MEIPEQLVEAIAEGRGALFVGAGLSQGAGLKGWPGLLRAMLERLEKRDGPQEEHDELIDAIERNDLLAVAEELRERLGLDEFRHLLSEEIRGAKGSPSPTPTDTHRRIHAIPFGALVTTNYDQLIEGAYALENQGSTLHAFTHQDVPELAAALRESPYLLKLHGDISRIDGVVLGSSDYRQIIHANPACRKHLSTLFATRTVLFVGYGLGDPDLLLLLDELRQHFADYTTQHYALMPEGSVPNFKRGRFEKDYGIRILTYSPTEGHPEVSGFLQALAEQVEQAQPRPTPDVAAAPVERLASEVGDWLEAIGYTVELLEEGEGEIRLLATMAQGSIHQRVRVHCVGGEIRPEAVKAMDALLDRHTNQGWLVSDQRLSPQAATRASELEGVEAYRLADLLTTKVWAPYFTTLEELVMEGEIPERYVDPACHKQEAGKEGNERPPEDMGGLDAYIDGWLNERGKVHLSLLGDFGTGKTWFCRHYAWRRLQRYLENPAGERLPLLVTLRDFVKTTNPKQLINDLLLQRYNLPFVGSPFEAFQELNRRGKLLLILDGFDEMARKADFQTVIDNFWELAKLVDDESKVILTSRTEYFRWAKESEKVLGGEEYGRRTVQLEPPRFEVLYLTPFDDERIRRLIEGRLGPDEGGAVADKVLERDNLKEMARKPVLTALLLAAIDEAGIDALDDQASIYLHATKALLLRNIDTERTFTTTADKLYFLCELAWEMIESNDLRVHYREIPERIRSYFGEQIEEDRELDHWDYDLRNQTLLHRNAAGYYEFAHKSLAEWFVALKFTAELGCLDPKIPAAYGDDPQHPCPLRHHALELSELATTFGHIALTDNRMSAIFELLPKIMRKDAGSILLNKISKSNNTHTETTNHTNRNIFSMMMELEIDLRWENLSGTSLSDADTLTNTRKAISLRGTNLDGADLSNASLFLCDLSESSLQETNLTGVSGLERTIEVESIHWLTSDLSLIAGTSNGSIYQWSSLLNNHHTCNTNYHGRVLSLLPQPKGNVILTDDTGTATALDLTTKKEKTRFQLIHSITDEISINSSCGHLLGKDKSNSLILLDANSGKTLQRFQEVPERLTATCLPSLRGPFISGHESGVVYIRRTDGIEAVSIKTDLDIIYTLATSEDKSTLYAYGYYDSSQDEGVSVYAIDLPSTNIKWITKIGGPGTALSPGSQIQRLAVGGWNEQKIYLLDPKDGALLATFNTDDAGILCALTFSPDEKQLASGHDDGTVRIWDVDEDSPTFGQCQKILDVKLNARGARIGGAKGLDEVITWKRQGIDVTGTRLQFLADCGAILDEDQQRRLKALEEGAAGG